MNGQYNLRNPGKYCLRCGAQIPDGAGICTNCGYIGEIQTVRTNEPRRGYPGEAQAQTARPADPRRGNVGETQTQTTQPAEPKRGSGKKKTAAVIVVLLVIAALALFFWQALGTPPDMRANPRGPERMQPTGIRSLLQSGLGIGGTARDTAKYTFLVLGTDRGDANSDVIMAVTFDTSNHALNVVNIPRDTLANVSWRTKKANSIFANMRARNSKEDDAEAKTMDATVEAFADILGYEADYWIQVDLKAFVELVDAVGGVDFDVPVNMNYVDKAGGLSINYSAGTHHLSGQQAIEVLRYRSGYASGDIGRIGTQQAFLKSAAGQILEKRSSLSISVLANTLIDNVRTNIALGDLIWFGKEFMKLDADSISFQTMPGKSETILGLSYVTINVDEWLELVNEQMNPFSAEITTDGVSILTRGADRKLYVTDGNWQGDANWGR